MREQAPEVSYLVCNTHLPPDLEKMCETSLGLSFFLYKLVKDCYQD